MFQKFKRLKEGAVKRIPLMPDPSHPIPIPRGKLFGFYPEIQKQKKKKKLHMGRVPSSVDGSITVWEIISGQRGTWAKGAGLSQSF